MNLPPNKTEREVLEAIEKAVNILCPSFVFGYYDLDDIKQQARLYGLQGLDSYDPTRPLENFLYTHIRNRLINFRRDKLRRSDPPCPECAAGRPCCSGDYCDKYTEWLARNNRKANLMRPLGLDHISDEREHRTHIDSTVVADCELAELMLKIDTELPVELRGYYLQMRDGVSIPRAKREAVLRAIQEITRGELPCPWLDADA